MVCQDQRQGARDQAGDAVGVDVNRIAQAKLGIGQDLAPVGIEDDVLACAEERDQRCEIGDCPQVLLRMQQAEQWDDGKQGELGDKHPAPPPAEQRQRVAVDQRRPEEFPRVRELDQREQADRLQIHVLRAQPRRQQVDQQVERQTRRKAGEDADQHPAIEQRLAPAFPRRGLVLGSGGGRIGHGTLVILPVRRGDG